MDSAVMRSAMLDSFKALGGHLLAWADPAVTGVPMEDRDHDGCSNPAKYRVLTVRSQAWAKALCDGGLAEMEQIPDDPTYWWLPPANGVADQLVRVLPKRAGALPLLFTLNALEGAPEAQVGVGAGDPGVLVETFPQGYFDAYDTGSPALLDEFDDAVLSVVTGRFTLVASDSFIVRETLGGRTVSGTDAGMKPQEFSDLLADARAGRTPYMVVDGVRWW